MIMAGYDQRIIDRGTKILIPIFASLNSNFLINFRIEIKNEHKICKFSIFNLILIFYNNFEYSKRFPRFNLYIFNKSNLFF